MKKYLIQILLFIIILSGCTRLAPIISVPEAPYNEERIIIKIDLHTIDPDIAQTKNSVIKYGSSIVIKKSFHKSDFSTREYFHVIEQHIENKLITKGFSLLSREKFKAEEHKQTTADYLLQIDEINENDGAKYKIDFEKYKEFMYLINTFPKEVNQLQNIRYIECPEFSITLNAKLIHVKSGRIVWIGTHTVSTRGLPDGQLEVSIGIKKYTTNIDQIRRFVDRMNTEDNRKRGIEDIVHFPAWVTEAITYGPTIKKGICEVDTNVDKSVDKKSIRKKLSREVAAKLIESIKVGEIKDF